MKKNNQQGIALVVVLGLLAMLLIMAVSFAISMRVERLAGRDTAELVKAQNLALTALARAMAKMENDMLPVSAGGGGSNTFCYGGANPSRGVSVQEQCGLEFVVNRSVGLKQGFSPSMGGPTAPAYLAAQRVTWTDLKDDRGKLVGQYGFVVLDCSGYLDINTIAKPGVARNFGADPGEVAWPSEVIPDMTNTFNRLRNQHRVESLLEAWGRIFYLCLNPSGGPNNYSMMPFSYFPNDKYISTGLGVTPYAVSNRYNILPAGVTTPAIRNTMLAKIRTEIPGNSSFTLIEAAFVTNLWDYVDASLVPRNLMSFGTKPVPMINEVVVSNRFSVGKSGPNEDGNIRYSYTNSYNVGVEVWYPFIYSNSFPSMSVRVRAAYAGVATPPPAINQSVALLPAPVVFLPDTYRTIRVPTTADGWTVGGVWNGPWQPPGAPLPPLPSSLASAAVTLNITVHAGVPAVDLTTNLVINIGERFPNPLFSPSLSPSTLFPASVIAGAGKAADDPRINWNGASAAQWAVVPPGEEVSLGSRNPRCTAGQPDRDTDTGMYVRRGPLQSIGELGFLLYNQNRPWRTVRLFRYSPTDADPERTTRLFDMFTIVPTNQITQGLVNPNALSAGIAPYTRHALQSVFNGVSRGYPGQDGATVLTESEAGIIAGALLPQSPTVGIYTNLSDVCRRLTNGLFASFIPDSVAWQRKMVMARTIGLLNPRQNLWLIAVTGRAVKDVNNDEDFDATGDTPDFETARAMAVAMVWRDPYEDPTDTANPPGQRRHRSFVQWFGWF